MKAHLTDPKVSRSTYAMVDEAGVVVGLVLWNGVGRFDASELTLVKAHGAQIGWTYGAGLFSGPGQ